MYHPKPREWLIKDFILRGKQHALNGRPGVGKSLFMLQQAIKLSHQEPVLFLDYEMNSTTLFERLDDMEIDHSVLVNGFNYYTPASVDVEPLDTSDGSEMLEDLLRESGAKILVVDSFARAVQGDENDAGTYRDYEAHTQVNLVAQEITTILVDHISSKSGTNKSRGSTRKEDLSELIWSMNTVNGANTYELRLDKNRFGVTEEHLNYSMHKDPLGFKPTGEITVDVATDHEVELHQQAELTGFDVAGASRKTLKEHIKATSKDGKSIGNTTASRMIRQAKAVEREDLSDPY